MPTPLIAPTPPAAATQDRGSSSLTFPTAGTTTIDDKLSIEVELACYEKLRRITTRLALHLAPHVATAKQQGPVEIFFLDHALRTGLDLSSTIEIQLSSLREAYAGASATARAGVAAVDASALPQEGPARARQFSALATQAQALAIPAVVADAAVALIGALQTDTRYFGRQVTIPEQAFALALAHEWEGLAGVRFHYPTLFAPPSQERDAVMTDFVAAFDAVLAERTKASTALATLLTQLTQLQSSSTAFALAKAALDTARDQFQAAEAVFEDVSLKLNKADEKTGLTQLQMIERAIRTKKIAEHSKGQVFYLFAQVVSAGGAFRVSRNLIRMLLWGDGLEHSGGAIVTFGLFDAKGHLKASDTIGGRSPYVNSRSSICV